MKSWLFVILFLLWGLTVFATSGIVIDAVLPNTSDDANLEYIEIADITCFDMDITGYVLRDASGKSYLLSGTLSSWERRRVMRPESKIILNNTDERIDLLDASGALIDQFLYATSAKDIALSTGHYVLPQCMTIPEVPTAPIVPTATGSIDSQPTSSTGWVTSNTWAVVSIQNNSGSLLESTWSIVSTGSVVWDATGAVLSTASWSLTDVGGSQTWTTDLGGTATWTSQSSTWSENITQTGSILPSSNVSSTGSSISSGSVSPTPSVIQNSGSIIPVEAQKLIIEDTDDNGKIDRLTIEYSAILTGSLDASKIVLYSATGGLASTKIESSTGVIESLTLSGSELIIDLIEWDIEHLDLHVNTSTSSHIRLKTYLGFGLKDLNGHDVEALTYTKSFHAYAAEFIENTAYIAPPTVPASGGSSAIASSSIVYFGPSRSLSDPIFSAQSWLSDDLVCRSSPCRINFIFTPKFAYERCSWIFEWWNTDAKSLTSCNPRSVEFTEGDHQVTLNLFEDGKPENVIARTITIRAKSVASSAEAALKKSSKSEIARTAKISVMSIIPEPIDRVFQWVNRFIEPIVASRTALLSSEFFVGEAWEKTSKKTKKDPKVSKVSKAEKSEKWLSTSKKSKLTTSKKAKITTKKKSKKIATTKKPKLLARQKVPSKIVPAISNKAQNSQDSWAVSNAGRAAAAWVLAVVVWMGGYFVGRRRSSTCDARFAS